MCWNPGKGKSIKLKMDFLQTLGRPLWSQTKLVFGIDMNGVREIKRLYKKVAHNKNTNTALLSPRPINMITSIRYPIYI